MTPTLTIPPTRVIPHVSHRHMSRNHSDRHGAKIELITLHATQGGNLAGIKDLAGLGDWFDNMNVPPRQRVSAHAATDAEGHSARYVRDIDKAWHCAYFNSVSLGLEQVGFSEQQHWPELQLQESARWIAFWSTKHGIPIRHGRVTSDGRVATSGVVRHSELGNLGGNHHDPDIDKGDYPLHEVLQLARWYKSLHR